MTNEENFLCLTIIGVIGFVVQDKSVVNKVKRIRSRFKRMCDHLAYQLCWERWELVNVLASVSRVWNAVPKVEVESLQQAVLEVMPLNHPEIFHIFIADLKLDAERTVKCDNAKA